MRSSPLKPPSEPGRNDTRAKRNRSPVAWVLGAILIAGALGLGLWGLAGNPNNPTTTTTPNTTTDNTPPSR